MQAELKIIRLFQRQDFTVSSTTEIAKLAKVTVKEALQALHKLASESFEIPGQGTLVYNEQDAGKGHRLGTRSSGPVKYYWFFT